MKLLFNYDLKNYDPKWNCVERPSARAIIQIGENQIALVHSVKLNYYKFPGGGIHENEEKIDALVREVQEETGLIIKRNSIQEYGYIKRVQKSNYKENTFFSQDSFYYTCQVEEQTGERNLDEYEAEEGFELAIVSIDEAIRVNKNYKDSDCFNVIMVARDTLVLERLAGKRSAGKGSVPSEHVPSEQTAELLLKEAAAKNPGLWEKHSYAVAEGARKIAEAIVAAGGNMDPQKAYVTGLLHDIGRQEGYTYLRHVLDGYDFLMQLGYESCAKICLTHSFNLHIVEDYIGKNDLSEERYKKLQNLLAGYEYDDYDRLIQLLDSTCGADGTVNLEERMTDVKNRYGYYPEGKWNKNFELKEYFEVLMKRDYYEVLKS